METFKNNVEPITKSEVLATWEIERTHEQLLGFIASREAALSEQ